MSPSSPTLHYHEPGRTSREVLTADLCVYGGTAGGVAAGVQAARLGLQVVVVENSQHLGGLTASGLGLTDFGNRAAIGGIAREFYALVGRRYGVTEELSFEPHVAEAVFDDWADEAGLRVLRREYLASVRLTGRRLEAILLESGRTIRARMFIDASYEGDLLAAAGVSHVVGREANAVHGETINGMVVRAKHQFDFPVDPYRTPGAPGSGFLPGIEPGSDFAVGRGDGRIQAYNFRMCLTRDPANRIPFFRPGNYDRAEYELLARYFEAGWRDLFAKFDPIRGGKTDTNNHGAVSTDFIGRNHRWPAAGYAEREAIFQAHVTYQQGLQWFLSHDPAVPADLREEYAEWGLARDEFVGTAGWPHALYIREARRMVGDYVMTEHDCRGTRRAPDVVALGAYGMDSHNCRRIFLGGRLVNEGDVQEAGFAPYPIALRALLPRRGECSNLIVSACISASHIAYGSLRMEPVFMMLGHAAAVGAELALRERCDTQDLPYSAVAERLIGTGQVLDLPAAHAVPNQIV